MSGLRLPLLIVLCSLPTTALADNHFSVGAEWFRDTYTEADGATVDEHANYKAITAGYEHDYHSYFTALDGRYGETHTRYKSDSGVLNGTPDFETDLRARTGMILHMSGGIIKPYVGVGWRYLFDNGKGLATDTGALAYDRHISQIYIPIGATFEFQSGSWIYSPTIEIDPLAHGWVNSHLGPTGTGEPNIYNTQHSGMGFRADFMVGQQYKEFGWQFGPFVRYWHISDSDRVPDPLNPGYVLLEPKNYRLQYGADFKLTY